MATPETRRSFGPALGLLAERTCADDPLCALVGRRAARAATEDAGTGKRRLFRVQRPAPRCRRATFSCATTRRGTPTSSRRSTRTAPQWSPSSGASQPNSTIDAETGVPCRRHVVRAARRAHRKPLSGRHRRPRLSLRRRHGGTAAGRGAAPDTRGGGRRNRPDGRRGALCQHLRLRAVVRRQPPDARHRRGRRPLPLHRPGNGARRARN